MMFPVLEVEKAVQVQDKTRFNAAKSFVSKGATALTTLTIKPGADASAINCFDADPENWYLDWKFDAMKADIDSTNNKIDFSEAGVELAATIASGTYTLTQLLDAVITALEAAGAGSYDYDVDKYGEVVFTSDIAFKFLPLGENRDTSALPWLGFREDTVSSAVTHTSKIIDGLPRAVTLTVGDGVTTTTETQHVKIMSEVGDALFSSDSDLRSHEYDILKFVEKGRSSFKNVARTAQELILSWLDEKGYVNINGRKFTKFDILDKEEVRQWSKFMCLRLIFRGVQNEIDDVFDNKSKEYASLEAIARNRTVLRIDLDGDKKADLSIEVLSISSGDLVRR